MEKLIFVYNADSGFFSAMSDYLHKIVSPDTYACSLCKMTYSNLGMKKKWKEFIENLDCEVVFLHKDELAEQYSLTDVQLPALYKGKGHGLDLVLDHNAIDSCKSLNDLISLISTV